MRKFLIIVSLIAGSLVSANAQDDFLKDVEFDQSKTVHAQSAVAEAEAQWKAQGGSFLLNTLSIDPPLDLEGFANEYRANAGGPVSAIFGISPFQIQSGLVKGLMGFLMLTFTGGAVYLGLQRVASGQGDLNLVPLFGKFAIGMLVIIHPDYVYAVGRTIQTSGLYIVKIAMESTASTSVRDAIKASDMTTLAAGAVESKAIDQGAGNVAAFAYNRAYTSVDSFNRNYASAAGVGIAISDKDSQADKQKDFMQAMGRFKEAVGSIEPYKSQFEAARKKHQDEVNTVGVDSPAVNFLNQQYFDEIEKIATDAGDKLFGISETDKAWDGVVKAPGQWFDKAVESVAGAIGAILIPFAAWVLIKGSAMSLELTLILVVLTFPLWMLDSTKAAFTGTLKAFFTCAIVPSVGYVLLSIFEAFAAFVFKIAVIGATATALPTGLGGTVAATIGYIVFWVVGVLLIIWKTPKISASILAGGSVVASLASVGMASMASGLFAAAGVSSALVGLGATAPLGAGAQAAIKGAEVGGKALNAGAKAFDSETPTAGGQSSATPAGDKAQMPSPEAERKAKSTEDKLNSKRTAASVAGLDPDKAEAIKQSSTESSASSGSVPSKKPWHKYDGPPMASTTAQIIQVAIKAGAIGVLSGGSAKAAFQILATQKAADLVTKNIKPNSGGKA